MDKVLQSNEIVSKKLFKVLNLLQKVKFEDEIENQNARKNFILAKPDSRGANTRYIFVTGGVASSLGKGIASASLASLLQCRGFTVKLRKLDPYLNVDPGTMSPY